MKVRLTFKTPDIADQLPFGDEARTNEFFFLARKWIKYAEMITVEIDTKKKTCVVVEA